MLTLLANIGAEYELLVMAYCSRRIRQQYPIWARDAKVGFSTINAKAETITMSPTYREAFKYRRCLVPADAFYEWVRIDAKTKQPFAIALKSGETYGFAGLWERWKNVEANTVLLTFTIITTDPNEVVQPLHDRMPVVIPERHHDRWLQPGDPEQPPIDLLRPFDADKMTAWKVDPQVGNVRNDTPELIEPVKDDQADMPSLF